MASAATAQWRVEFDAEVVFSNGGALQAQGFRLDIPGTDIDDGSLGELFIRHLGLLMVGEVTITRRKLIQEPHKGSRGVAAATAARPVVDLGAATLHAPAPRLADLVDLPGVVVRVLGAGSAEVPASTLAVFDVTGAAVLLHGGGRAFLSAAAADWLVAQNVALVGTDTTDFGPAGMTLSRAGVPVLTEVKDLELAPPDNFRLHVVPLRSVDVAGSPVRVYTVNQADNSGKDTSS